MSFSYKIILLLFLLYCDKRRKSKQKEEITHCFPQPCGCGLNGCCGWTRTLTLAKKRSRRKCRSSVPVLNQGRICVCVVCARTIPLFGRRQKIKLSCAKLRFSGEGSSRRLHEWVWYYFLPVFWLIISDTHGI